VLKIKYMEQLIMGHRTGGRGDDICNEGQAVVEVPLFTLFTPEGGCRPSHEAAEGRTAHNDGPGRSKWNGIKHLETLETMCLMY
jgi:hypothetical protein